MTNYSPPFNLRRELSGDTVCLSWDIPTECFKDPEFHGTEIQVAVGDKWLMLGIYASFWSYFTDLSPAHQNCKYRLRLVSLGIYSSHQSKKSEWVEI